MLAGKLGGSGLFDQRRLMAIGLVMLAGTLYAMSNWTPDVSAQSIIVTLVVQGFSMGLIFNPLSVMAFTTLPATLRGDGAALLSLFRNIGSAIGISVTSFSLTRLTQVSHADMAAVATPFNRLLHGHGPVAHMLDPSTGHGAQMLDALIGRQAQIIAYNDDFRMMTFVTLPTLLMLLLMRRPGTAARVPVESHAAVD